MGSRFAYHGADVNKLDDGIKGYTQWREALWLDATLRQAATEAQTDIRATAEVIALRGANGRGCVIGTKRIAERIGCERHLVSRHRTTLIRLGWFTPAGKS